MSKRFGRNQKRQMREQIAFHAKTAENLSESLLMAQGLTDHISGKLSEANEILGDVAMVLGRNFVGLKPEVRDIDPQQREYPYRMQPPIQPMDFSTLHADEVPKLVSFQLYELEHVYPKIVRDRISEAVHIYLQTPDGRKSYAVSGSAWLQMKKDRRRMLKEFAPMIADELARFIAGGER
jgi:hypothetical protein